MEKGTGAILLVIGVVALFAAIVGGGVKIKEIEVGSVPSRWRQSMLAIFGVVVGLTGLIMVSGILDDSNTTEPTQNVDNAEQDTNQTTSDVNATDQNVADETANETNGDENNSSTDENAT
jgi:hypothetical protein